MIKSLKTKAFLQNTIFTFLSAINKRIPHKSEKILFYSNLEFRDNIKYLCDYIVDEGLNEKYEIICASADYRKYEYTKVENVKYVDKVSAIFHFFSSKYVFYCIGKLPILPGKGQQVIQLWHGAPFKAPDKGMMDLHSFKRQYYTGVLSTCKHFIPVWSHHFSFPKEKIFVSGFPRCDMLFKENPRYDFGKYDKLILWTPTFRQAIFGYDDTKFNGNIIPVLSNKEIKEVDEYCNNCHVKIIVKLHPAQILDCYELIDMEHFVLLSHVEFVKRKIDLYRLMKQADALITDYSSVFFDYLLLNRPIAFTEDDIEDYSDNRGFSLENPDSYKCGFRIKTKQDLFEFIDDVVSGVDDFIEERKRVNELCNDYRDGGFCKRVLDVVGITK